MNRLAIFDCDGTLADSQATICQAMDRAFAACAIPAPGDAAARRIIGLSLPEAMQVLHPDGAADDHAALALAYKAAFVELRGAGLAREPLFDGIRDVIDRLDRDGWLLGVATGKSDRGLRLMLEQHGLHPRFVTLQTADRHPSKPHPSMLDLAMAEAGAEPATTVMIGDTSFDMAMARAAGCFAVGVSWGYHREDALWTAGAHRVAHHPSDLPGLLAALA